MAFSLYNMSIVKNGSDHMEKIKVENLTFSYDGTKNAVDNITFSIKEGSYTTIVGHNGSGKSTIAKLIMYLMEDFSGNIYINQEKMHEKNIYELRNKIGIVFQNPDNQFIGATVADDIAFGLENHQVESEKMNAIIEEYAKKVGMIDYLQSEPAKLSGGQKQRVAIAGVLAMQPEILILDEATSMLDPQGKADINALIKQIHNETKMTIVSITHDMDEVANSDEVIVMNNGKKVMQGKPIEVLLKDKELLDMKLDIPFALKFQKALNKQGVKIKPAITLESVVNELCQLSSKN